jgi:hypothetical protein
MQHDDRADAACRADPGAPAQHLQKERAESTKDPFHAWQHTIRRLRDLERRLDDARQRSPHEVARLVTQVRLLRATTAEYYAAAHPRERPSATGRGAAADRLASLSRASPGHAGRQGPSRSASAAV